MMLKGMTAQYLLKRTLPQGGLQAGDFVLFHAAAGGVGLIACQWARAMGLQELYISLAWPLDNPELAKLLQQLLLVRQLAAAGSLRVPREWRPVTPGGWHSTALYRRLKVHVDRMTCAPSVAHATCHVWLCTIPNSVSMPAHLCCTFLSAAVLPAGANDPRAARPLPSTALGPHPHRWVGPAKWPAFASACLPPGVFTACCAV